jgi:hypothetical protein
VLDVSNSELDREIDPRALAEVAGFSLHRFHRVFRTSYPSARLLPNSCAPKCA